MAKTYQQQKEERAIKRKEKQQQMYNELAKKTRIYSIISLVVIGLLFILFFTSFAYVHNTDYGAEVSVSGYNFVGAFLTNDYTSHAFGNIAVPFNYYAEESTKALALYSFICLISLFVLACINVINMLLPKNIILNVTNIALNSVGVVLFLIAYSTAIGMKNDQILSIYCSNNPACSIRSSIIILVIFLVGIIAINSLKLAKLINNKKNLKK